jgi:esterase/lipase
MYQFIEQDFKKYVGDEGMKNSSLTEAKKPSRIKKIVGYTALSLTVLVAGVYLLGPRNSLGEAKPTPRSLPPSNLKQLDAWIQSNEAAYTDIKNGNAKGIVWHSNAKKKTPWSVVYIHGFSASRLETAPLADHVAGRLGANAFHTRLTGHGRSGAAMAEATPQDWMADAVEAVHIGRAIGEKVLVISVSTGSTLSTWLATSPYANQVSAHVFMSPNYGPKDKNAEIINAPWGKQLAGLILGPTRSWEPDNDAVANGWTTSYPSKSLFPMMALVKHVRDSDLSSFNTPVMIIYSETDTVVDPEEIKSAYQRIGSNNKLLQSVTYSEDKGQHALAGDIRSPGSTATATEDIVKWVASLP